MQEWLNWPLSKSGKAQAFEGSNPSLSARNYVIRKQYAMTETIFTKIINGDISSHKVYEDETVFAFLDIHPVNEGHVLVVPKKSVEFIWDLPASDYRALMAAVQKIGTHVRSVLQVPHVGVLVEGTGVPHAHVHIIPFVEGHELRREADMSIEPNHDALAVVAKKISLAS